MLQLNIKLNNSVNNKLKMQLIILQIMKCYKKYVKCLQKITIKL